MKINLSKITPEDFTTLFKGNEKVWRAAIDAVEPKINFDLWQLTIKDLGDFLNGNVPEKLIDILEKDNKTAADFLKKQKAIELFFETFTNLLSKFSIKPTAEEIKASRTLPKFNETEGLLVFVRKYFNLTNFTDAENVTLSDLFLAKKDEYISGQFQKNLINNKNLNNKK